MDREFFVQNIKLLCKSKRVYPTVACRESGVGTSFITDITRGKTPSVAKVQMLAAYLGVSTSELLGEIPLTERREEDTKKAVTPKDDGPADEDARLMKLLKNSDPELKKAMIDFLTKAQK